MTIMSRRRAATGVLAGLALCCAAAPPAFAATDTQAPRGAVGGISSPASGTMTLTVRATDDGLGLVGAEARVDGVVAASAALGAPGCDGGCPEAVTDLPLAVTTTAFPDGTHQLQVSVTDGAGNRTVLADQPFVINNVPPDRQSSALLTLAAGDEATGTPGGAATGGNGGGSAGVGAAGSGGVGSVASNGTSPTCLAPRLSMFLKDKPLRIAKGVPVLRRNGRYRYSGTLTCAVGRRRVAAPAGVTVTLRNQIGQRIYHKNGVTTRAGGRLSIILAYPSSRLVEFRYTSADGTTTRVRIRITVKTTKKAS